MRNYCITTDSNSDLPKEYITKYNTTIIPQYYSFGDTVYGDELHMPPAEFYEKMKEGGLTSAGTARGRKKSLRTLVDRMKATIDEHTDYTLPVGIVHGNCVEDANFIADLIKAETKFTSIIINDISPSVGAHAGPGALGILYHGQKKQPAK